MAATNINRVIITGNLTRDPELRSLPAAECPSAGCASRATRAARTTERRVGRQAQLLRRDDLGPPGRELRPVPVEGPPVAIDGRLEWREWQDQNGNKRQSVDIIADNVQFLGSAAARAATAAAAGSRRAATCRSRPTTSPRSGRRRRPARRPTTTSRSDRRPAEPDAAAAPDACGGVAVRVAARRRRPPRTAHVRRRIGLDDASAYNVAFGRATPRWLRARRKDFDVDERLDHLGKAA